MKGLIRWGKFNLVGAMGMVMQLCALAVLNGVSEGLRASKAELRTP